MTFFEKISRFFSASRSSEKAHRQKELEHRMELSNIRRQAMVIRREADRLRQEAISLEKSGDHARAVAKAAAAANMEKSYAVAQGRVNACENMHVQAKTQTAMKDLMVSCRKMAESVIDEVDVEGAVRAQAELQDADMRLEAAQEAMSAFQEGFDQDTDPALRNEAGEEALRRIMQEQESVEKEQAIPEQAQAAALPEAEDDKEKAAHMEWVNERRKLLDEMA